MAAGTNWVFGHGGANCAAVTTTVPGTTTSFATQSCLQVGGVYFNVWKSSYTTPAVSPITNWVRICVCPVTSLSRLVESYLT